MDGVTSVDGWLERLDEHGMIMLHSTGTTGKLSFLPRSRTEWPGWKAAFFEATRAATGVDRRTEAMPDASTRATARATRRARRCSASSARSRPRARRAATCLYDYAISSDLLSLAARLRDAEERGELDKLEIDPQLLEERAQLIEAGRNRDDDLERWFSKLAQEFRGQRVRINGVTADLIQLALKGRERGIECEFAPGSVLFTSGGMKGLKEVPDDWEQLLRDFFGIDRLSSIYSMTECMGYAPLCCATGYYHFFPYTIPLLLDGDGKCCPARACRRAGSRSSTCWPRRTGRVHHRRPDHDALGRGLRVRLEGPAAGPQHRAVLRAGGRR